MCNKLSILSLFLISWLFLLQCTQPQPAQNAQIYVTSTFPPTQQAIVATAQAHLLEHNIEAEFNDLLDWSWPPHCLWFEQTYQGIPFLDKKIVVVVDPNKPTTHTGAYGPEATLDLPQITPAISQEEALTNARQTIGFAEANVTYTDAYLALDRVPKRGKISKYILVWFVTIASRCPSGSWAVLVDAQSGEAFSYYSLSFPPKGGYGPCPTPIPLPTLTPAPMSPFETPEPPTPTPSNPYLQKLGIFEPGTVSEVITNTTSLLLDTPLKGELLPLTEIDWYTFTISETVDYDFEATFTNPNAEAVLLLYGSDQLTLINWQDDCYKRDKTACLYWHFTFKDTYYLGLWLKSVGENGGTLAEEYTIQVVNSPTNK